MKHLSILCILSVSLMTQAFSSVKSNIISASNKNLNYSIESKTSLFSANSEDGSDSNSMKEEPPTINWETADKPNEKSKDYPLDVPSPVLLSSSMVLAIASIGSIFEVSGGSPAIGMIPSIGISAVGIPASLFLFYAAIKKGIAETEADDAKFQQRGNRF